MYKRVAAVSLVALGLVALPACGSANGAGAPSQTTIKIGAPNFQTVPPILTTTIAPAGDGAALVPGEQQYTVVAGDTVVGIARLFCVDPTPLAEYNQWPEGYNHYIFPGDVVRIPPNGCAPGSQPNPTTATPEATTTTFDSSSGAGLYEVQEGDYLNAIAEKLGTTVDEIVAANGWPDGKNHNLYPGDKIKVPTKTD